MEGEREREREGEETEKTQRATQDLGHVTEEAEHDGNNATRRGPVTSCHITPLPAERKNHFAVYTFSCSMNETCGI